MASMNGLDMLVFTGTAGTRSASLRKMICSDLEYLDVYLDEAKNDSLEGDGFINRHSKTGIAVIETDEMREIANQASEL